MASDEVGSAPIIVLSYLHSGGAAIQQYLAERSALAATAATGIIPLCETAAESWRRVEGRASPGMSPLALAAVRALVAAQVTTILAQAGKNRWCELVTASPATVGPFREVFPGARFISVHRNCPDVIRAGIQASPWGLHGQGLLPFLLSYPGNNIAALAAHWATATEELLVFEAANPTVVCRVLYEDMATNPASALKAVIAALQLNNLPPQSPQSEHLLMPPPAALASPLPTDMIPPPLRARVERLNAELGYPPLEDH